MPTLPQPDETIRRLQIGVSPDAYRRIKVGAAQRDMSPGQLVSEMADRLLPRVPAGVAEDPIESTEILHGRILP